MYNSPACIGHPSFPLDENTELHPINLSSVDFGNSHQGPLTVCLSVREDAPAIKSISNCTVCPNETAQMSLGSQKLIRIFSGPGTPELPILKNKNQISCHKKNY